MEISLSDINFNQLSARSSLKTVVLCVNNRYARRVLEQFNQLLGEDNKTVAIPSIVPQHAWIQNLANTLCFQENNKFAKHVFSGFAAQQLWQKIIKDHEQEDYFLNVNQMAKLSFDANNLINEWDISVNEAEYTKDYERFLEWQKQYNQQLHKLDAEDINLTYKNIGDCLDNGAVLSNLENLVLVGFNQISPRLEMVLIKLQNLGVNLYNYTSDNELAKQIQYYQLDDEHSEWQQAILWAKDNLLNNPRSKFAIVVPNPSENIHYIHRLMQQHLTPAGLSYNIAAAPKLSEWPIINTINLWLNLLDSFSKNDKCDVADVGAALLSLSVLNNRKTNHWAASLDRELRHKEIRSLDYKKFTGFCSDSMADFVQSLDDCIQLINSTKKTTIDNHIGLIRNLLNTMGFVDNIELDSVNWQCLQAFDQGLNDLLNLVPVFGSIYYSKAIRVLEQFTQNTTFQPQRDANSRLDVLGFLEAEGGYWDGVWVLGLTDKVFPAQAQPNPLIPWAAMQRSNAPRSTPERELLWAQASLQHIKQSAPTVCFSYAQLSGDETLKASALLEANYDNYIKPNINKNIINPIVLETIDDDYGPKLSVSVDGILKGGVSVLDTQSRNPLWAFVKYRLGAVYMPDYAQGFNPIVRGIVLHDCMYIIWSNLQDKEGLIQAKNNNKLDHIIKEAFEQATQKLQLESNLGFDSKTIHELELTRTVNIINAWLDLEIQRQHDFKPLHLEHVSELKHNGLKLSYRVDRIDQLHDGRKLIIDYKSGITPVAINKNWTRKRLIDLQLPLYATGFEHNDLAGLAFVRLNSRATDAYGLSDGDCGIESLRYFTDIEEFNNLSWQNLIQNWHKSTRELIDEYVDGYAANKFINDTDIQYCDVLPFLRLQKNQND